MHGQTVELTRQADGELADVDHFLDFTVAFGLGLAHLQRNQRTQRVLVLAQGVGAQTDRLATARRRRAAPDLECRLRALDDGVVVGLGGGMHLRQGLAIGGAERLQRARVAGGGPFAIAQIRARFGVVQAERSEDGVGHEDLLLIERYEAAPHARGESGRGTRRCREKVSQTMNGDPDTIRTCDLSLRRGPLYPAELRGQWRNYRRNGQRRASLQVSQAKRAGHEVQPFLLFMVERRGIEPLTSTMRTWRSPS